MKLEENKRLINNFTTMKKIKFLSCAAMAAFFAMSLTSCEKENFTTDVEAPEVNVPTITIPGITIPEGYKPGDAVIAIQPTVIGFIDGEAKTITDNCKFTYNGKDKFEYTVNADRGISAMTVEIVASYDYTLEEFTKAFTATHNVSIPALSAGMVAVITPTLIINAGGEVEGYSLDEIDWNDVTVSGKVELKNENPYFYTNVTMPYAYDMGRKVINQTVNDKFKDDAMVNRWMNAYNDREPFYTEITVPYLYAESSTLIPYEQMVSTTNYEITKTVIWNRSGNEEIVVAASFTVEDLWMRTFYTGDFEYTESTSGHGSHYHGHGHGDSSNAGGGITWAE